MRSLKELREAEERLRSSIESMEFQLSQILLLIAQAKERSRARGAAGKRKRSPARSESIGVSAPAGAEQLAGR